MLLKCELKLLKMFINVTEVGVKLLKFAAKSTERRFFKVGSAGDEASSRVFALPLLCGCGRRKWVLERCDHDAEEHMSKCIVLNER